VLLIGISGRKSSGKSTASQLLCNKGFKRASFAAGLKEHLGKLYNWTEDDLLTQNGKEELLKDPIMWNKQSCYELSKLIDMNLDFENDVIFNKRREALQYIGTDVLRKQYPNFHIDEFKKRFSHGDFVCDDLRFVNELDIIKELNGISCHIVRPYYWDYSNHTSEISLTRKNFDYIFINDGSLHKLIRKFELFFKNYLIEQNDRDIKRLCSRQELISTLTDNNQNTTLCAKTLNCSRDTVIWWMSSYMIPTTRNKCQLNHDAFFSPDAINAYWAGLMSADGTIKKHLKHDYLIELSSLDFELIEGFQKFLQTDKLIYSKIQKINGKTSYSLTISSPYIVEDFKLWNLEPLKSRFNKIPDCIRNNDEMMSQWIVGLIDGDGSICYVKNNKCRDNISLSLIASKDVVNFIYNWLNFPGSITSEKGIDNLYNVSYTGKSVVGIYNKIYRGVGLKRKWNKVESFLNRKWVH
jgi:hypothetical protein